MNTMSYSAFRKELAKTLDRVNDNHLPVMITRQNGNWILFYSTVYTKVYYFEKLRPFWSGVLN